MDKPTRVAAIIQKILTIFLCLFTLSYYHAATGTGYDIR